MPDWIVNVVVALLIAAQASGVSSVPEPASITPEPAAVDAYLADIIPALSQLGEGATAMGQLMGVPAINDPDWQAQADATFTVIQEAHAALLAYQPAQALMPAHTTLTDATKYCADSAATADAAIEDGNVLGLYAAAQLATACGDGLGDWGAQVEALRE